MAIILPSGFIITNTDPIDSRITLPNSGSRYALAPANIYPGLTVYQRDTQVTYVLIDTGSVSNSTGWQALVSAGSNQFSGSQVITGSLTVTQGITGSLFGTSSYALTASYVAGFNFTGYQIATGSVTASVNTDPTSIFLIQSASLPFLNISSNSNTTVSSDLFIIRGFTSQQPVLTVSQSIVNIATHSIDPSGTTIAGSIYFTSGAMYVGLE
jgi:hypothetical protein